MYNESIYLMNKEDEINWWKKHVKDLREKFYIQIKQTSNEYEFNLLLKEFIDYINWCINYLNKLNKYL